MWAASEIFIGWSFATSLPSVAAALWGGILNLTSLVDRLDLLLSIVLSVSTDLVACGQHSENESLLITSSHGKLKEARWKVFDSNSNPSLSANSDAGVVLCTAPQDHKVVAQAHKSYRQSSHIRNIEERL